MPFEFERQNIEDVILVKPKVFGDNRGFFMETYKKSEFIKKYNGNYHTDNIDIKEWNDLIKYTEQIPWKED